MFCVDHGFKVAQKENFGEFVNFTLGSTPDKAPLFLVVPCTFPFVSPSSHTVLQPAPCLQLITRVLYDHLGPDDSKGKSKLGMVPQSTMQEFFLPLEAFNLGADTKNGCRVWVNNQMFMGKFIESENINGEQNALRPFSQVLVLE